MEAFKDAVDTQRQIEHVLHQLETEYSPEFVDKLTRLQEKQLLLRKLKLYLKYKKRLDLEIGMATKYFF